MKTTAAVLLCGLVGAAVPGTTSEARAGAVIVETFTGQFRANIRIPLNDDGGGGLVAPPGPLLPLAIDFAPGSVTFQGQPVDFDGTEASFLASSYEYSYNIPVNSGPATVPVPGGFGGNGSVWVGPVFGGVDIPSIDLGPAFSQNNLDITPGQGIQHQTVIPNWQSAVVPELNGRTVIFQVDVNISNVDPINGIVDAQVFGNILAIPCPADLDNDGFVGITDFLLLLGLWGPCPAGCAADLDNSGAVGVNDFLLMLGQWGPCP
jgi:hypothetical protein